MEFSTTIQKENSKVVLFFLYLTRISCLVNKSTLIALLHAIVVNFFEGENDGKSAVVVFSSSLKSKNSGGFM